MERDTAIIIAILAAIVLGTLAALVWPKHDDRPVTCTQDEQCGGVIETARFCKEGILYANGQRNTCLDAGKTSSRCLTTYSPWKISDTC